MNTIDKTIARQAKEIYELQDRVVELTDCLKQISSRMTNIGGPLNDDVHEYTNEQSRIFYYFRDIIQDLDVWGDEE